MEQLTKGDELLIGVCQQLGLSTDEFLSLHAILSTDRYKALFVLWLREGLQMCDLLHLAHDIRNGVITEPPEDGEFYLAEHEHDHQ